MPACTQLATRMDLHCDINGNRRCIDGASPDIEVYNSFVQETADAARIAGEWDLTWIAFLNTEAVDRRENTNTDPEVDGIGGPSYFTKSGWPASFSERIGESLGQSILNSGSFQRMPFSLPGV